MSIKVSVVIPNFNGKDYLDKCISSLLIQDFKWFEIIIVDDCSTDQAFNLCREKYADNGGIPIKFIKRRNNGGFCACVNDGIINSDGQYVLLLNNDTEADKSLVGNLYKAICNKNRIFSVGAKMIQLHNQELLDDTGDLYCLLGWAFAPAKDKPVSKYSKRAKIFASCGGCAIYRRDVLLKLGLFDDNHFAYLEDIDIGYRAKLHGYVNMYEPSAVVYHAGSATSGSRHNDFKVRLAAQNSIYLVFKNMAYWQLLVNWPMLFLGILIKLVYSTRKGLGQSYLQGLKQGFVLCHSKKGFQKKVDFRRIPLGRVVGIECELIINTFRRLLG